MEMEIIPLIILLFAIPFSLSAAELVELDGGPDDVVWVVQLSDLHFSVHHPDRAEDATDILGPTLSFVNPLLVFITGDLTDGKSKDMVVMKQDEKEWIEYEKVMNQVVERSGIDKSAFYDLRGNHDNFGVPMIGGSSDYFSKYSINGQLQRRGKVNSITIQTSKRKLLFVGFDSTMSTGLRGPTNLFGHPTDELLAEIDSELSQWDSQPAQSVTKISFGHFPLSFSAASTSGKTLKDVFIARALDAYLCGHLHLKFGKNLKQHHRCSQPGRCSKQLFQLNGHRSIVENTSSCSDVSSKANEFWEWEMGDWRSNRAMRILAIDRGHISFVDVDFKMGAKKAIILPTFPLDSRFTSASSPNYKCDTSDPSSYGEIRAMVFSASPILSVLAKIYDSKPGKLVLVLETPMTKLESSRGDLYVAPWNAQAFEDPSPERFRLQIEATDVMGRSTASELRPFSITGLPAKFSWSWKEFFVMGCQWDALYNPILWLFYFLVLSMLLIPKIFLSFSRRQYTYRSFKANKCFTNCLTWIFVELYNLPEVWPCLIVYLFYLLLCPWFYGQVLTEDMDRAYMTYRGWVMGSNDLGRLEFLGFPDVMVVVLMHLYLVVFPTILTIIALAAESGVYQDYLLSISSKKKDDYDGGSKNFQSPKTRATREPEIILRWRWFRKFLLFVTLAIFWRHFKSCRALSKAYEMNPVIHFPLYCFTVPLLLGYTVWKTWRNFNGTYKKYSRVVIYWHLLGRYTKVDSVL
ncbi:putative metallophosphoesterase At3g03305 isoform X2 [Andrographis paniculata]|uniref:putative metallophosphoesterase At3g03305 isoform X2 n=1 Tax=Andrographis paniculata TaxID=175694 RepID=UPI0021E7BC4B|nr:putative metallophosphoesterase At3g03305 isoform X2 [Andrographis paniculata]